MINDAHEWLQAARAGYTDPMELQAIDELLSMGPIVAAPSVANGKVVWLFTGAISQLAIPIELMPDLTRHAREAGLLENDQRQLHFPPTTITIPVRMNSF